MVEVVKGRKKKYAGINRERYAALECENHHHSNFPRGPGLRNT
jgi:hypothetical protein